jgi:hypothetical protein
MEKKIEVACECPKSDITSMTKAFSVLSQACLSKPPQENEDEYEGDRTAADYADDEPNVFHNIRAANVTLGSSALVIAQSEMFCDST